MLTQFDRNLVEHRQDTFIVSKDKIPMGFDLAGVDYEKRGSDGKWSQVDPQVDGDWEQIRVRFDWYVPKVLTPEAIAEATRIYTEIIGEPTSFYKLATSDNGIKLTFNALERNSRRPEGLGRGAGVINNITNLSEQFFDKLMELSEDERKVIRAEYATTTGKDRTAFMKKIVGG